MPAAFASDSPVAQVSTVTQIPLADVSDRSNPGLAWRIVAFLRTRVPDLHAVKVAASGGTVIVRGILPSAHEKWLCLECCRHVAGVVRVIDELQVAGDP